MHFNCTDGEEKHMSRSQPPTLLSVFSEAFSGPSNLQFTGQTSDSLRFRWNPAGGPVSGYTVQYVPLSGLGQQLTLELRQVGLRDEENISGMQKKNSNHKRKEEWSRSFSCHFSHDLWDRRTPRAWAPTRVDGWISVMF